MNEELLRPQLIAFDLDGTLVDSVPDLAYAVDRMLAQLGLPQQGEQNVRLWVGNGARMLVRRALAGDMSGEVDEVLYDEAYPLFLEYYRQCLNQHSMLYPGVLTGLEQLQQTGLHLACITNKPIQFTTPLLAALGLDDLFGLVIGGDSLAERKPHPMPLLHVAEHFSVSPSHALMVGDSKSDIDAAKAAGFASICVDYGYNQGLDVNQLGADRVISQFSQLADLLPVAA